MKKETLRILKKRLLAGVFTLMLVTALGLFGNELVCHAESQGKVTASSAKIRQQPTVDSLMIEGAEQGTVLTVLSQTQGADGYTWYQVQKGDKVGYIRGDLMTIIDGSTPPAEGQENNDPPAEVTAVNPVNATMTSDSGRIRSNASVNSSILAEVQNGQELTVTGQATDSDGALWYQVSYFGENQVDGFIRFDYVTLSGEITPVTDNPPPDAGEPSDNQNTSYDKPYDTQLYEGEWVLYDTETNDGHAISELLRATETANKNAEAYEKLEKSVKSQKIIIIILIFLLVAAVAGIAFLIFKIRDMMDSAYFSEVENETLRKRSAAGKQDGQKVMHTVGAEKPQGRLSGTKPQGAQPKSVTGGAPAGSAQVRQKPAGGMQPQRGAVVPSQRPAGAPQGQRPAGAPQGQRPAGTPQNQRPAGAPQGQRAAGTQDSASVQRMPGASQGRPQGAKPIQAVPKDAARQQPKSGQRQPKNFMADDEEEFEFEFLNYDGEDDQQ